MLDRLFRLSVNGTDVKTKIIAGIAGISTFLSMAYIIAVNSSILSQAGMDFVATCIASAFGIVLMGLWANYPVVVALSMGRNALFTFSVVLGLGAH